VPSYIIAYSDVLSTALLVLLKSPFFLLVFPKHSPYLWLFLAMESRLFLHVDSKCTRNSHIDPETQSPTQDLQMWYSSVALFLFIGLKYWVCFWLSRLETNSILWMIMKMINITRRIHRYDDGEDNEEVWLLDPCQGLTAIWMGWKIEGKVIFVFPHCNDVNWAQQWLLFPALHSCCIMRKC